MTNVKTPKNSKDLENLDGEAGMTWEEAKEKMLKDKEKVKFKPRPQDLPDHPKRIEKV